MAEAVTDSVNALPSLAVWSATGCMTTLPICQMSLQLCVNVPTVALTFTK